MMSTVTQKEIELVAANPEKHSDITETKVDNPVPGEGEPQWVTGTPLYLILLSGTLASFTILLDTSIVATVS